MLPMKLSNDFKAIFLFRCQQQIMVMKNLVKAMFLFLILGVSCKEPFVPEVDAYTKNLLVVEGYLNIGGITNFRLSRTADLQDWQSRIPEANARVEVQGDQGTILEQSSSASGECLITTTGLDINKRYRIKITTANGKIYQTDFLASKATPEIDSVVYKIENNGFSLYVNTHDKSNQTRFYSWDYHETWEIRSPVSSNLEYKNGKVVERDRSVNISRCWQNATSSSILINSTERLSEDRVLLAPLNFIPGNSIKLSQLYSILVRQYGLSQQAYQYLENMKKNTEKIGTIFDPQPSELKGNLTCITDPHEQVIGWIGAGKVTEKRIFINSAERLREWAFHYEGCDVEDVRTDSLMFYIGSDYLIYDSSRKGYIVAKAKCIDCRLLGSNVKPSFWPN